MNELALLDADEVARRLSVVDAADALEMALSEGFDPGGRERTKCERQSPAITSLDALLKLRPRGSGPGATAREAFRALQ